MILTDEQINVINEIIEKHFNKLIGSMIGVNHLSQEDIRKLSESGELEKILPKEDYAKLVYLLGKTRGVYSDKPTDISIDRFKQILQRNPVNLTDRDQFALDHIRQKFENYISGLRDNTRKVIEGQIRDSNYEAYLDQLNEAVKPSLERAIEEGRLINELVRDLRNRSEDIYRDWKRVAVTELNQAYNKASVNEIGNRNKGRDNDDVLVYMVGPLDAATCQECIKFYHDGGSYKIYRLSELKANGTNYGKKRAAWLPTIPPAHPNCFLSKRVKILTENGWKQLKNIVIGEKVLTHNGKYEKVIDKVQYDYKNKLAYRIEYIYNNRKLKLSVTPDHKFLTQRGWIEAKNLNINDKFIALHYPCIICGKQVRFRRGDEFILNKTCSQKCLYKLRENNTSHYHESLTDEQRYIRNANCSDGMKKAIKEGRCKSIFSDPNFFTVERRKNYSDSIKKRMPQMLKASASTRISKEQKLAFGWLKGHFVDKDIQLEYPVSNFAIDIAFVNEKIAVEIDGKFHDNKRRKTDNKRDDILKSLGWSVLRFGYNCDYSISKENILGNVANILNNHDKKFMFNETKIIKIHKIMTNHDAQAFCLTVEKDHSFIVRGIVSHNCRHRLVELPPGFSLDENGKAYYVGPEHHELNNDLTKSLNKKKK